MGGLIKKVGWLFGSPPFATCIMRKWKTRCDSVKETELRSGESYESCRWDHGYMEYFGIRSVVEPVASIIVCRVLE